MKLIFKHIWIIFIIIIIINALVIKLRSRKHISNKPELKIGYDKFFKGYIFYGSIPWLIIGFGNLSELTNSFFDFLKPKEMNTIVLIFYSSIILLWVLSIRWIYFKNGAKFIKTHPGLIFKSRLLGKENITERQIKILLALIILGGIISIITIWTIDIPITPYTIQAN